MALLTIHLLGTFRLLDGDRPLTTRHTPRLQALLAYLLLHRAAPVPRARLAVLFWPDTTDAQARTNLRNLLHALREALPPGDYLLADPQTIGWNPAAALRLDVADFEAACAAADPAGLQEMCIRDRSTPGAENPQISQMEEGLSADFADYADF